MEERTRPKFNRKDASPWCALRRCRCLSGRGRSRIAVLARRSSVWSFRAGVARYTRRRILDTIFKYEKVRYRFSPETHARKRPPRAEGRPKRSIRPASYPYLNRKEDLSYEQL